MSASLHLINVLTCVSLAELTGAELVVVFDDPMLNEMILVIFVFWLFACMFDP